MSTSFYRKKITKLERIILIQFSVISIMAIACVFMGYNYLTTESYALEKKSDVVITSITEDIINTSITVAEMNLLEKDMISEEQQDDSIKVPEIVFEETEVTGNIDIDVEKLKETINIIAPELQGIENEVIEIYYETGIKPSFQLAKFCLESGYGKSSLSKNKNNIAGWNAYPANGKSSYENATIFESKGDCVLTVGKSISKNYVDIGLTSVASIAKKYCPVNSVEWTKNVKYLMNDIEDTYESLT